MDKAVKTSTDTRIWDWLSLFLLLCALFTVATRLVATRWTDELYLVQNITIMGAVLGMILGISRYSPRVVFFFALAYGAFVIPWQMSLSLHLDIEWKVRLQILWSRILETLDRVSLSKDVQDNTLFVLIMSLLFWAMSLYAGYSLVRHGRIWRAVLPAGLVMLIFQVYDPNPKRVGFLIVYIFFMLILLARFNFAQRQVGWKQNRVLMAPDIGLDWLRYALIATVLVIALSWVVPALAKSFPPAQEAWQTIRRPWVDVQDRLSSAFASLRSTVSMVTVYYNPALTLGSGSPLSDTPVLSVKVPPRDLTGIRYYWRAFVYDQYENRQWKSTLPKTQDFDPTSPNLQFPEWQGRWDSSFTVTTFRTIGTLILPSQPLWTNLPAKAFLGLSPDGSADLVALEAKFPVVAGVSYEVRSSVSAAKDEELRNAGTDYPQYIRDFYLQLPTSITNRTKELATQLSQGQDTPYDVATSVTNYLRTYEYSAVIDPPPTNQEVIDWFLFDYKKGFCQYYATAEVILLRSLGIPARLSVGYAAGEFQTDARIPGLEDFDIPSPSTANSGTYLVRQRDAHAWPEVYFPGIGWVEFEPTASQSPLIRASNLAGGGFQNNPLDDNLGGPGGSVDEPFKNESQDSTSTNTSFFSGPTLIVLSILLLLTIIIVLTVVYIRRKVANHEWIPIPVRLERGIRRLGLRVPAFLRNWAHYASLSPLVHAYLEINRALKLLGKPAAIFETPAERVASLSTILPTAAGHAGALLAEYQRTEYSLYAGDAFVARQAGMKIRKLSYQARLQQLIARIQEPYVDTRR